MSDSIPPKPDPSAPRPVLPLAYGTRRYGKVESRPLGTIGHFFLGVGAWLAVLALGWLAVGIHVDVSAVVMFLIIAFFVLLGLGSVLSTKFQWRAFTPGVLIGAALTCLTPIGIIAVACGGMQFGR